MNYKSIFNDVLSPVCPGPSAGCTGGSSHIGRVGRALLGEAPGKAVIEMSPKGSFPLILSGMRNDVGLIHGLLGRELTDPRFLHAFDAAKAEGLTYSFVFKDDVPSTPATLMRIRLTGAETGRELVYEADSIGGGNFVIFTVNDCPVNIHGFDYDLLLFCGKMDTNAQQRFRDELEAACGAPLSGITYGEGSDFAIWDLQSGQAYPEEALRALAALPGVTGYTVVEPEQVVVAGNSVSPPFTTAQEFISYVDKTGISLFDAAIEYEAAVSGWDRQRILQYADRLWSIVEEEIRHGEQGDFDLCGIVPSRIQSIRKAFESGKYASLGATGHAALAGLAIMEHSSGSGVIMGAPTGGSAGLMPATIYGAAIDLGLSREKMVEALMVAGVLGIFMAEVDFNGAFSCSEEIGSGAAMAAGALVYLYGGTAQQACDAASTAVQCLVGLICNTLCGLVQVPCFIRNMAFPAVAMICANATMGGLDCPIPLDEASHFMAVSGKKMFETGISICSGDGTPTGCRLNREFWKKNDQ